MLQDKDKLHFTEKQYQADILNIILKMIYKIT